MKATWDKLETIEKFSKWMAWFAVALAFLAGGASLVEEIINSPNITSIALAFLSGIAGLSTKIAGRRKQTLESIHRRTKPEIDVAIKTYGPSGRFLVTIEPRNEVPFEFRWLIVTRDNVVVSGLQLDWSKVKPNELTPRFSQHAEFQIDKVVENYIELRFDFRSVYADELPAADLSGRLRRAYILTSDKKHCIPTQLQS